MGERNKRVFSLLNKQNKTKASMLHFYKQHFSPEVDMRLKQINLQRN